MMGTCQGVYLRGIFMRTFVLRPLRNLPNRRDETANSENNYRENWKPSRRYDLFKQFQALAFILVYLFWGISTPPFQFARYKYLSNEEATRAMQLDCFQ